ncbi:hypothetical protein [Mycobacterium sp. MMS18-G62]
MTENADPTSEPSGPIAHAVDAEAVEASALPTNPRDRRATLVVASIAAVAALFGALIGGIASYQAAKYEANATRQEDLEKFRRDERKQAYRDYLQSIAALSRGAAQISNDLDFYPKQIGLTTFNQDVLAFYDLRQKSDDAGSLITLLGSKSMSRIVGDIHETAFEMSQVTADASNIWNDKSRNRADDIKAKFNEFDPLAQKFSDDLMVRFIGAARADLGITD